MALWNADVILQTVASYRLCWISGRFGGGKTSIAYRFAWEYLKRGYRLISNNLSAWNDGVQDVDFIGYHLRSVILLDEGGLWFKVGSQVEMIASYAAKMDCIYLFPSFWPPTRKAQVVVVQPVWNLKSTGLPLIMYRWRVREGGFEDKGFFIWWHPEEIYGVYSRQDPGDVGSDIVTWLTEKTSEYRGKFGRADKVSSLGEEEKSTESLQEAVEGMGEFADRIIPVLGRKRRR